MLGLPAGLPGRLSALLAGRPAMFGREPIEHAQRRGLAPPQYTFSFGGKPHLPEVTCACVYAGHRGHGNATTKQEAKRRASMAVIERLAGAG